MNDCDAGHGESLVEAALNHVSHGIIVYDENLIVLKINRKARDILQVSEADFSEGEPFEKLVRANASRGGYGGKGEADERVARRMERARQFKPFTEDQTIFDGARVEVHGRPIPGGGYVLTYTDVTERYRAQGEARENEARFRDFASSSSDWLWEVDSKLRFTYISERFTDLTGIPVSAMIGRRRSEVEDVPIPDDQMAVLRDRTLRRLPFKDVTYSRPDPSGCERHLSIAGVPVFDRQGNFAGYRGTGTEVTREMQMLSELRRARTEAENANAAKSIFLANMSHEIRTPMNGVVGMAEILSRTDLRVEQSRMVQTIRNSSQALLRIIDDILDLSKIEAGKLAMESAPLVLRDTLEALTDMLRPIADQNNVRLSTRLDASLPKEILGDAVRLRQVLMNLLSNAVKFSRREPGVVPGQVEIHMRAESSHWMSLSVRDDGVGISQENLAKLFKPFVQAEDSTTREYGGTGLGLVIVKNLVDMMNGEIEVESVLGEGSLFTVRLPIVEVLDRPRVTGKAEVPPPRDEGDKRSARTAKEGLRILLVEDNEINQDVISMQIKMLGHGVVIAANGSEGLKLWREGGFDMVLTDCHMPEMDGFKMTGEIRGIERETGRLATPIVAITANALQGEAERCLDAGMDDYLSKPVELMRLREIFGNWLPTD